MKYTICFILILINLLNLTGCKKETTKVVTPKLFQKKVSKKSIKKSLNQKKLYKYKGTKFRDPMVKPAKKGRSKTKRIKRRIINKKTDILDRLKSSNLTGIVTNKDTNYAILENSDATTYTIRDGRVLDSKENVINGLKGIIKEDHIIIEMESKNKKILFNINKTGGKINDLK